MKKIKWMVCAVIIICGCTNQHKPDVAKNKAVKIIIRPQLKYSLLQGKDSIKKTLAVFNPEQKNLLSAINRVDSTHLMLLDTLLLPDKLVGATEQYLPFPGNIASLSLISKIIFFSYPAQVFAAYQDGNLIYTGQTNMGREKDPTPDGLFFTNWKAEKTTSTFNDEWDLKWNFNIENKEGIGFHEFALPGYPASHSCLRLTEADAKFLYNWADQWIIKGANDIQANGTPVIVFGAYPFGSSKPWYQLATNSHALDISEKTLQEIAASYLPQINEAAEKRSQLKVKDD